MVWNIKQEVMIDTHFNMYSLSSAFLYPASLLITKQLNSELLSLNLILDNFKFNQIVIHRITCKVFFVGFRIFMCPSSPTENSGKEKSRVKNEN